MRHDVAALSSLVRGQLLSQVSLAKYSSWRCGGAAEWLFLPADCDDLQYLMQHIDDQTPIQFLGLGSNTLVRSGGLPGVTVVTLKALKHLRLLDDQQVFAQAGVPGGKVARFCARHGLVGLAFLAGVPGTIGGALKMNAGAYGGQTWEYVAKVQVINRQGEIFERLPSDYMVRYRYVCSRVDDDELFLGAWLTPQTGGEPAVIQDYIKQMLNERNQAQPVNLPNGGSIFRNPPGDYAARLIEACDLKGYRIGGACVSTKHANFIVNDQKARPEDIEALVDYIQQIVWQIQGVNLEREIHVIGDKNMTASY